MKKVQFIFLLWLCSFTTILSAQTLADSTTLIIHFSKTVTRGRIDSMARLYRVSVQDTSLFTRLGVEIWTIPLNSYPIVIHRPPAADTFLRNILQVSDHAGTGTDVSTDPNHQIGATHIGDSSSNIYRGLLPNCPAFQDPLRSISTGNTPITIAVMDCGIAGNYGTGAFVPFHSIFQNKIWKNEEQQDNIDNDGNGYIDDYTGWNWTGIGAAAGAGTGDYMNIDDNNHGSHVNGIIAQILTYAPTDKVKIMNLKTQNHSGTGNLEMLIRSIDYAITKGAKIVNLSLSYEDLKIHQSNSVLSPIIENANNILFVVAAGNRNIGKNLDDPAENMAYYPAYLNAPNMIVVGASKCDDSRAEFSNYGVVSVDIAAPGVDVFSALKPTTAQEPIWGFRSGTSMATPMVATAAALLGTRMTTWNTLQVKNIILQSGTYSTAWNSLSVSKKILNIPNALRMVAAQEISKNPNSDLKGVPNPFSDRIQIRIQNENEANVVLSIQNAYGQVVLQEKIHCQAGETFLEYSSNLFSNGMHVVKVQFENRVLVQKILKQS